MPLSGPTMINSTFDFAPMLSDIKKGKERSLVEMEKKERIYNEKNIAWSKIKLSFDALKKNICLLQDKTFDSTNNAKIASVNGKSGISTSEAFSVQVADSATANNYKIKVNQLASAHKLRSNASFDSAEDQLGDERVSTRCLIIEQKNGSEIKINLNNKQTSLSQISSLINQQKKGVVANVIHGKQGVYFTLGATELGESNHINVRVENDEKLNGIFNAYDQKNCSVESKGISSCGLITLSPARNAEVYIDNILCSEETNNIKNVLTGITINLHSVSNQEDTLTLSEDSDNIKKNTKLFISSYNNLVSTIYQYNSNNVSAKKLEVGDVHASLGNISVLNDRELKSFTSAMPMIISTLTTQYANKNYTLADVGISRNSKDGLLCFDEHKFELLLATRKNVIDSLMVGTRNQQGLVTKLQGYIEKFTQVNGSDIIKDNISKNAAIVKKERGKLNERKAQIDSEMKILKKRFDDINIQATGAKRIQAELNRLGY